MCFEPEAAASWPLRSNSAPAGVKDTGQVLSLIVSAPQVQNEVHDAARLQNESLGQI